MSLSILPSCNDETIDIPNYTVEGQDVTLSIPIKIPEMEVKSRASLPTEALNTVNSLWIRTYSSSTGLATSKWLKLDPNTTDTEVGRQVEINIDTQSGYNYIVGVANVENLGIDKNNPTVEKSLSELLDGADTWTDFLNIAVVSPSDFNDVNAPATPLPMAGCYIDINPGSTHPNNLGEWQKSNFTPYFIPAQKSIVKWTNGAIHLRRLVSNFTFNVLPGNDNIEVTVNSYAVSNAPKYSWLYERSDDDGMTSNYGDFADEEDADGFYVDVPQFPSQYITKNTDGTSVFNFWLAENKHEGTSTTYQEREIRDTSNRSLFTSLTGSIWTPNNMASYIRLSCTIDYKNQISVGDQGQMQDGGTDVYRTGNAEYYIHLGYIEGSTLAEKSKDFNCYRNTDYTYNITVNGIDDIRVDAWANKESYPGEEGQVSDLQYATIELDAHYHVFNINLTQTDLSDPNFGFIITSYYNGIQYNFDENTALDQVDDAKLYNWIELRPTTGRDVLSEYKPRYGSNADGKTFLLTDLKGGWNSMTSNMKSETGWYTVFVNEYTYENMFGSDGYGNEVTSGDRPNWMNYVNQNPRRFYIRVTRSMSVDGNSIYTRSKYGVSQKSIQTYYSDQVFAPADGDISKGTAIGTERENETEGLNICRPGDYGNDASNGRFNAAQWLQKSNSDVVSINSDENSRPLWSNFVDLTKPMQIPAVNGERTQGGPDLPDRTGDNAVKLPKLANSTDSRSYTYSDPQASNDRDYYIDVYNACMSRNRDNNGNGRIDPEELRWYIPAMGKYLRLLLGAPSLSEPLMNFSEIARIPKGSNNGWVTPNNDQIPNDYLSRYMFSTSDGARVLWAMEGMSTSTWSQVYGWSTNNSYPWQVRCIRNLGTDLRSVSKNEKVTMAYVFDETNREITFTYYDNAAIRQYRLSGNGTGGGAMPTHNIISDNNKPYKKFEYASSNITVSGNNKTLNGLQNYILSNPCSSVSGTGWRVPNQKELAILLNRGTILTENGSFLTCTYNYFNSITGVGGGYTNGQNYFLGMLGSGIGNMGSRGTLFSSGNLAYTMYVRCVRDVD